MATKKPKAPKKYRQAVRQAKADAKGTFKEGPAKAVLKDPAAKKSKIGSAAELEQRNTAKAELGKNYVMSKKEFDAARQAELAKAREAIANADATEARAAELEKRSQARAARVKANNAKAKAEARAAGRKGSPLVQTATNDRGPRTAEAGARRASTVRGAEKAMKAMGAKPAPSAPVVAKKAAVAPAKKAAPAPVKKAVPAPAKKAAAAEAKKTTPAKKATPSVNKPKVTKPKATAKPVVTNARTQAAKGAAKAATKVGPKAATVAAGRMAGRALSPKGKIGLAVTGASLVAGPVIKALKNAGGRSQSVKETGERQANAAKVIPARSKATQAKQDAAMAARKPAGRVAIPASAIRRDAAMAARGPQTGINKRESAMAGRATTAPAAGNVYRVNQGDTLEAIAKKAGVSLADLKKANPKAFAQKYIYRNTKVNIPTGGKVPSGGYTGPVPYKPKKK
jgi:LysM repeat protein